MMGIATIAAETGVDPIMGPVLQYGFAGMCALMMGGFYVLARAGLRVWANSSEMQRVSQESMRQQLVATSSVIEKNTSALMQLADVVDGQQCEMRKLADELAHRPCLKGRE